MRPWFPLLVLLPLAACDRQGALPPAPAAVVRPAADRPGFNGTHPVAQPADPFAALKAAFDGGLRFDGDEKGFLRQVLATAGVDERSQVLVFSKTSHQLGLISHDRPRALYFSDDCYIGLCQDGGLYELAQPDAKAGTALFALDFRTHPQELPQWQDLPRCLDCHEGAMTGGRAGLMVRSVFTGADSHPILSAGTRMVDHATPVEQRWGGWFVTGRSGTAHHMGNLVAERQADGSAVQDLAAGSNRDDLDGLVDTSAYLRPGSDIVALMVLEHQVMAHNMLTQTSSAVREYFERYGGIQAPNAEAARIMQAERDAHLRRQALRVVEVLLFKDEAALPAGGVEGAPEFQAAFRLHRRATADGRSLKDFDLHQRLFKHRCSYMIHSKAFREMDPRLKAVFWPLLKEALTGDLPVSEHLPAAEKAEILEILRATHAEAPAGW